MIEVGKQSLALISTFMAILHQHLRLSSQEGNNKFSKLQSLLEAKKWLLPIEKQSLCWPTTKPICVVGTIARWDVGAIELLSKYRLTPQLEIWQKVERICHRRFLAQ
jgi:hypothetical protein